jgi:CHAT domain-containing protein
MLCFRILILLLITVPGLFIRSHAQCPSRLQFNERYEIIDRDEKKPARQKLDGLLQLKSEYEGCFSARDSVYAKILHRIAVMDYLVNANVPTERTIKFTMEAARINTSGGPGASPELATRNYNNLGLFHKIAGLDKKAAEYYDSAIVTALKYPAYEQFILNARHERSNIFFTSGDYDKCIEESTLGERDAERLKDTLQLISFINQRAQAYNFQEKFEEAYQDALRTIEVGLPLLHSAKKKEVDISGTAVLYYELASAYKLRALSMNHPKGSRQFERLLDSAMYFRKKSGDMGAIGDDLLDYGSFYLTTMQDFNKARTSFINSYAYASGSSVRYAYAHMNLGNTSMAESDYLQAEKQYLHALKDLNLPCESVVDETKFGQLSTIGEKNLLYSLFTNKTEFLLARFHQTGDPVFLSSCIRNALLTDSLITSMRQEQLSEQSKLFWRKQTPRFFAAALEACYLQRNYALAFYFMESSRSVLLAEKLNELGASSTLPVGDALAETQLREKVIRRQQEAARIPIGTSAYGQAEVKVMEASQDLARFVKSLEKKHPAYYQYRYSAGVVSLDTVQKFLEKNKQCFVHYFSGDSVLYALGISGKSISMIKVANEHLRREDMKLMLRLFADKQALNNGFRDFAAASYALYRQLFQPLNLSAGRVIICTDNFLVPFDALCKDQGGKHFLIEDFAFSYVFSASYLFRKFPDYPDKGNFAGFAPISFAPRLNVADLRNSGVSLNEIAENYAHPLIFENDASTRTQFLNAIGQFEVVNVFSHANAETGMEEPTLFMQDSLIHLSELQYLRRPATKLVVLSACQTTAGKNATGEGIYSLARGFASAGIPSVAATLWRADEETIYFISEFFHKYLTSGMPKDLALRKAKLKFLQHADKETSLPYFWANMIVIGKVDPIGHPPDNSNRFWWIIASTLVISLVTIAVRKRRRTREGIQ